MIKDILINYWSEIILGCITTTLAFTMRKIKCELYKHKSIEDGMTTILRCQLYSIYNEALDKGYCPTHKKEQAEDIYASYHGLGANGTGTQVYEEILRLPTRPVSNGDKNEKNI